MANAKNVPMTNEKIRAAARSDVNAQPLTPERPAKMRRVDDLPLSHRVRRQLRLSQSEFAKRYHIPIGTIRDWDQGRTQPDAAAIALLNTIAKFPDEVVMAQDAAE